MAKVEEPAGKSLLQSKQFWFSLIAGSLQVADWAAGTGLIPLPYGPIVTGVVAILIRAITTEPIASVLPKA